MGILFFLSFSSQNSYPSCHPLLLYYSLRSRLDSIFPFLLPSLAIRRGVREWLSKIGKVKTKRDSEPLTLHVTRDLRKRKENRARRAVVSLYEIAMRMREAYLIRSNFIKTTYDISLDSQISFLPLRILSKRREKRRESVS